MRLADLKRLRVAVLGLGRDVAAVLPRLAAADPAGVWVVEEGASDTAASILVTAGLAGAAVVTSPTDLPPVDVLLRSPGFRLYRDDVQALVAEGAQTVTPLGLWLAERTSAQPTVGVTGTKGKSSTCVLVQQGLATCGVTATVAGNIGVPIWTVEPDASQAIVIEVSSFQAAELTTGPGVVLLTSLSPDHLDWHGSVERYYADKRRLFTAPAIGGTQVRLVPAGDDTVETWADGLAAVRVPVGAGGGHREANAALAVAAVAAVVGDGNALDQGALRRRLLDDYPVLQARLQPVATINGADYIDDALGTNPLATGAALRSVGANRPTVLILGGDDRGVPLDPLVEALDERSPASVVVLVLGAAGPRLGTAASRSRSVTAAVPVASVTDAVTRAAAHAAEGGVVLFSPCAPTPPSEGTWKDRSRAFAAAVHAVSAAVSAGADSGPSYTP